MMILAGRETSDIPSQGIGQAGLGGSTGDGMHQCRPHGSLDGSPCRMKKKKWTDKKGQGVKDEKLMQVRVLTKRERRRERVSEIRIVMTIMIVIML